MLQYSLRALKRFIVLIPGVVIAYLSIHDIFPYFDKRLPLAFAIFLTYLLGAYVLIPSLIRFVRFVRPPKHLPLYCVTPDGFASDPLNIGIVATRRQLITAMEAAGWHQADPHRWPYILRFIGRSFTGRPYPNAPASYLYLFGRRQDVAFIQSVDDSLTRRHHVRFWAVPEQSRLLDLAGTAGGSQPNVSLWVGAASLDSGAAFIRHNFQLTHMINPDTDAERELIVQQLKTAGWARGVERVKLSQPYRLVNRVWRGHLRTDGQVAIVQLKKR